jgi:hypothetical protein
MKTTLFILTLSFGLIINGFCQSQPALLKKAYKKKSVDLLAQFFDNWSKEIESNQSSCKTGTHFNYQHLKVIRLMKIEFIESAGRYVIIL